MRIFILILVFCCSGFSPSIAQDFEEDSALVTPELLERYNQLVRRARAIEKEGPGAVIKVYTEALVDPVYQAYGQIHLKLGTLLKDSGRLVDAAYHFNKCIQDHRVDKLDRSIICQAGYEDTTTTLELVGQPPRSKVVVLEPTLFSGPIQSGVRLPLGRIRLVVEVPGHYTHEAYLNLKAPTRWDVELGMKRRRGPLVPDEFLTIEERSIDDAQLDERSYDDPPAHASSRSNLPYWIVGGLSLAATATGLIMGEVYKQEALSLKPSTDTNLTEAERSANARAVYARKVDLKDNALVMDYVARGGGAVMTGTLLWYWLASSDD